MSCSAASESDYLTSLLAADTVYRDYHNGTGTVRALSPVSLHVSPGEFLVIRGPSGSGKSTLLALLSGMDRPSGGEVRFHGEPLDLNDETRMARIRNGHFGFIFQSPHVLHDRTVLENVALPARYHPTMSLLQAAERATRLLDYVGLGSLAARLPKTLSGGELQRVAFARALLCDPDIIFADEPTGNLDGDNSCKILDLLREQCDAQRTVIMVTHDERAMSYGSRLMTLDKFEAPRCHAA